VSVEPQRQPHPLEVKENFTKAVIEVQASMQFMYNTLMERQRTVQEMQSMISKLQDQLKKTDPKKTPDHAEGNLESKIKVNTKKH